MQLNRVSIHEVTPDQWEKLTETCGLYSAGCILNTPSFVVVFNDLIENF